MASPQPLTQLFPRLLAAAALLVVAACGSDDSSSDATDDPDNVSGAQGSNSGNGAGLAWDDCGAFGECALLEVPLDYDDPSGEKLNLGITRVPASGDRVGALFVNPGGPGGEVNDMPAGMASQLPTEITDHFDIVALDPRGVGEANLVSCDYDLTELYGVDHVITSPEAETELVSTSEDYVDSCTTTVGADTLEHMGTRNVARDMDMAREALGDEQISFLGYSYGTLIGQVYADLFPERVRAMVLDGVVEPGNTGLESAETQALGFETALASFADDCDARSSCPLAPDTLDEVGSLLDAVADDPIPASPSELGSSELSLALAMPLYSEQMWPQLAQGVADAIEGDGTGLMQLYQQYLDLANFDVYFAVNCLDYAWPDNPDEHLAEASSIGETAPHFGESITNDYIRCAMWPVEAEPLESVTAPGTPPILVVSTTNDPATPYESGVNVAETLEAGVLLTYEGDQHGIVGQGQECVDTAAFTYLLNLDPPPDGTTC